MNRDARYLVKKPSMTTPFSSRVDPPKSISNIHFGRWTTAPRGRRPPASGGHLWFVDTGFAEKLSCQAAWAPESPIR
ncbi:hypothetical protein BJ998_009306 [Kutzneria kofuensis]|uniref:Uncharacterized protein n=1 Tax=Kutzneria kofuensis TaxID=103725 RepID=A0A7W9KT12_9PSEU|nr:hypothetical protein [Kutzneria kofuensis]